MKLTYGLIISYLLGINLCYADPQPYFNRAALVDTGYDACRLHGDQNCEANKNLLFRGEQPLADNTFDYDPIQFREKIFAYLQEFKQVYSTNAALPQSLDELNQYRIVMINLLYDAHDNGSDAEYGELTYEFMHSGAVANPQMPLQHKIYGLEAPFDPHHFAFEWWPVAFTEKSNPRDISLNLNWPDKDIVPVPRSNQVYKQLDLPYLITGKSYLSDDESEAIDLQSLLKTIPNDGHPLLIFYHCVAGKDRTGAVTMSYLMKHGGYANISPNNKSSLPLYRNPPLSFSNAWHATTQNHYPHPRGGALVLAAAYCISLEKPGTEC